MASGLDYTIVRPTGLTHGREEPGIRISRGNIPKPNLSLSRRSLARFLIRSLADGTYSKQAVTLSKD